MANFHLSLQKGIFGVDFPFSEVFGWLGFSLNPTSPMCLLQAKPARQVRPANAQTPCYGGPCTVKGQMEGESGPQSRPFGVPGIGLILSFVLYFL